MARREPARLPFPAGIQEPSYNTWNIGVGFTYKVFTLDLRYSDTNLSKGDVTPSPAISHHQLQPGLRHRDQSRRGVRLQLVRRDRHREALG